MDLDFLQLLGLTVGSVTKIITPLDSLSHEENSFFP